MRGIAYFNSKFFFRVISILTFVIFLFSNIAYSAPSSNSIFKNKKVDYQKISDKNDGIMRQKKAILSGEDAKQAESQEKEAKKILSSHLEDISQIHIPQELGRIVEVYNNADSKDKKSNLIVHIQDLHTNPEAELNLAKILELLLKDYNMALVCSEGADGKVDTSLVSGFPDSQAKEKVSRIFIDSGELTGEEYLSITKYPNLPIWGIEDEKIYFQNIADFNNIMNFKTSSQVFISQAKKALEQLKPRVYSKEMMLLDQKESDYENKKIETDTYLKYLSAYIQKFNLPTADYKNISLLTETMVKEKAIDQIKIMKDYQNLFLNLQSTLQSRSLNNDLDSLIARANLFKDQKISPFSFYSYLKDLANKHLKEGFAAKYPELDFFVDYLTKVNLLDSTKLFVEMENLSYDIKTNLARNAEEKTLASGLRNIKFLEGFFNLKVSNEELDYYLSNKDSHKVAFFEKFLKPAMAKYNISGVIDYNPDLIDKHLQELEDFYKVVKDRDVAMVSKSVSEIEKRNSKVSALIAGGFHTKGITRLLRERGYSYIVVSPYSKTDIDEKNYHFLLSGKRKPLTEMLSKLDVPDMLQRYVKTLRVPLIFNALAEKLEAYLGVDSGSAISIRDRLVAVLQIGFGGGSVELKKSAEGVLVARYNSEKGSPQYYKVTAEGVTAARPADFTGDTVYSEARHAQATEERTADTGRGSVWGALNTFARLGIKAGDEITVLGVQPERLKDAGKAWSESSVRREFKDAESLGIIVNTGTKDENGREVFKVLVSLTNEQLKSLPANVIKILDKGRIIGEDSVEIKRTIDNIKEKQEAATVAAKLTTPLNAKGDTKMAASFLRGGYGQEGYGVSEGAAIDGSRTFAGNQGYYSTDATGQEIGKEVFLATIRSMSEFFKRRAERLGRPIRYVIKTGIGGQHTPFQGIADVFEIMNDGSVSVLQGKIAGEYELGKDFDVTMTMVLRSLGIEWDQVAVIPSSKSGSTDETMMIFVEIFNVLLRHQADGEGIDGEAFSKIVLDALHEINFIDGKERPGKDLFKVDKDRFGTDSLITLIAERAKPLGVSRDQVKKIFGKVLGNMFFETTDRVDQSRLSAFVRNSGLDVELGDDAPGFGAMFDNVGGRWTGDLHMMAFLAYYGLDAKKYWEVRKTGIASMRESSHQGNVIGNKILDEGIEDIALVLPDEFFWFGKSCEQNFNESIWQNGFANLVAIRQSQWDSQKSHYANNRKKLVINMTGAPLKEGEFNEVNISMPGIRGLDNQGLAEVFADLFTTFYGITNTVGNRLIARALKDGGHTASDVDLNDVTKLATKIVQANLFLRQPFVELGKGLLENKLKALQAEEAESPGAIDREFSRVQQLAGEGRLETNIEGLNAPGNVKNLSDLTEAMRVASEFARANGRKFVPFIYLEGDRFYNLRDYLISLGIEWVMQGTGDQHISYQQVLAQPQKYLPFIVSFVPEKALPGRPAIGFAKGYLNNVGPHMVRDLFADASYRALTESRKEQGGLGLFLRMTDSENNIGILGQAVRNATAERSVDAAPRPESLGAAAAGFAARTSASLRSVTAEENILASQAQERLRNIARVDTVITETRDSAEQRAARKIADLIKSKNAQGAKIVIGFATGGTYQGIYEKLIKITEEENISWENVVTFNLDEYVWNSPGYDSAYRDQYYDIESYQVFMRTNLFTRLIQNAGLKEGNIHFMNGLTDDAEKEVRDYEALIMEETSGEGVDLQVLGVGVEGHIAFIEARPDMPLDDFLGLTTRVETLAQSTKKANSRFFGDNTDAVPPYAMTQGISTILKAKEILLVATGSGKSRAITETIAGKVTPGVPASVLQVHKNTTIIVDKDAAQGLIGLAKASRRQQADSMDQIVAIDAAKVISDKEGFESWIAEQPENVAVVIIAMSDAEYENVRQYENIAFIKVFGRDIKGDENRQALIAMFGEFGTSELFGGFKLGTAGAVDQYRTAAGAIAEGV